MATATSWVKTSTAKQWGNLNNINYATQIKFWVAYFDAIICIKEKGEYI